MRAAQLPLKLGKAAEHGVASKTLCRPRARALTSVRECRDIQWEADMTPRIPESVFTWLSVVGNTMPPRDPNDDDDEEGEEDDGEADEDCEPAVIREPDEDE
jgi:hypothetical protein